MNNELFCTYNISSKLRKLGFNEECLGYFQCNSFFVCEDNPKLILFDGKYFSNDAEFMIGKDCSAPTWQQAKSWFLKNHGLDIEVISAFSGEFDPNNNLLYFWKPSIEKITPKENNLFLIDRMIDLFTDVDVCSKYEANIKAFEKAIELVENMKK